MALINIKKLYLAICNETDSGETFDTPEYVPGVQKFSAKPKINTAENYEEGVLTEQDSTLENVEVSFGLGHMSNIQMAKYLGHHVATTGGVYAKADDIAPYVALLYSYEKGNHKLGYKTYYKGKLTEPDDTVNQKEGKTDYQGHTVTATFQPLKLNGLWKHTIEEDDENCPANIGDTFFNSVIIPDEDNVAPTVSSVPADAATGVLGTADVVFTFSKTMDINTLKPENIFLMKEDGTSIATTLNVDTTNKIVTLHPATSLAAGSYIAIATTNVKSVAGIALATRDVVNFTV